MALLIYKFQRQQSYNFSLQSPENGEKYLKAIKSTMPMLEKDTMSSM